MNSEKLLERFRKDFQLNLDKQDCDNIISLCDQYAQAKTKELQDEIEKQISYKNEIRQREDLKIKEVKELKAERQEFVKVINECKKLLGTFKRYSDKTLFEIKATELANKCKELTKGNQ